jgi:hypothetical protein
LTYGKFAKVIISGNPSLHNRTPTDCIGSVYRGLEEGWEGRMNEYSGEGWRLARKNGGGQACPKQNREEQNRTEQMFSPTMKR